MKDTHPYPQDITADPFLVFGGLFSRKVVAEHIAREEASKPDVFTALNALSDQCSDELALQRGIENLFNSSGIVCIKNPGEPRFDRLIKDRIGIEIKLNKNKFDPQFWSGSTDDKNAVEQTRRYLDQSSVINWALLTNGKVLRLMHKNYGFNFLDIWICDSDRSGKTPQATFFEKILRDQTYLEGILTASVAEKDQFNEVFSTKVQSFWEKYQIPKDRERNLALVELVLLVGFYRYLEDCGILPVLENDFQQFRMNNPCSPVQILKFLTVLREQRFLSDGTEAPVLFSLISDESLSRIKTLMENGAIFADFKLLFWQGSAAIDLSDLKVSFFGDAYQLFANKTDLNGVDGQYFTGSELARDTAMYFVEDEKRGIASNEIIFDPFVGSGQLLRALVPFFHLLVQGELREASIISGMRVLAKRLAGTDIDANACWLARLSLTVATSEKGKPLLDFGDQIKQGDVFGACFGFTESKWQEALGIKGLVKAVITNPPWRRLRQTTNELYTIETGAKAPMRANKENWAQYRAWLKNGGKLLATKKADELKLLSKKHRETFKDAGQREVNVSISGLDFVNRLPGAPNKKWVVFMPDCFFVGQNKLRTQRGLNIRKYYSYPYNEHFDGADSVMKFGVVFGGGSPQPHLYCHPMGRDRVNVKSVFERLDVLPIFGSVEEAIAQSVWFDKAIPTTKWSQGEFHETIAPQRGAIPDARGVPVRGAKECNDRKTHSCTFNPSSVSHWKNWNNQIVGARTIVRDKRSNTKVNKVLWSGVHIPGKNGVPSNCGISNAWNYIKGTQAEVVAISKLLNSPLADLAMRSIGSKRNINPKDLNKLGLPVLSSDLIEVLSKASTFSDATALILLLIFELSKEDAKKILAACSWVSEKETREILLAMDINPLKEANELLETAPKRRKRHVKNAEKRMGSRSRRKRS